MAKNLPVSVRDAGDICSIPGWERSPGGENGNPLLCSCLAIPIDGGVWWTIDHGSQRVGCDWACIQLWLKSFLKSKESQSCSVVSDSVILWDSTVHGILQARILEWLAVSFSRGSSQPRDQTQVLCIAGRFFSRKVKCVYYKLPRQPLRYWINTFASLLVSFFSLTYRKCRIIWSFYLKRFS